MSQTVDYAETNKQTNKSILEFMALKYFYFFLWYVQGWLSLKQTNKQTTTKYPHFQ